MNANSTNERFKRHCENWQSMFWNKNGYGRLVVMSIECFEKMFDQSYEAREINKGIDDLENNKILDGKTVLEEMKNKYGL